MQGMDRNTGKKISNEDHLFQSIEMILRTPIGSRVMLPEFGSDLYKLVAAPMNASTDLRIYAAVFESLSKWEPRLLAEKLEITDRNPDGSLHLTLTGQYNGEEVTLNGIRVNGIAST